MASQHGYMTVGDRRAVVEEAQQRQRQDGLVTDIQDVRFARAKVPPIEGLPVWSDGKKCITCRYIRRTRQNILMDDETEKT
jgi:hypothetical protein